MSVESILGFCILIPSLVALIVLLFIITFKTLDSEDKLKRSKIKMFNTIAEYYDKRNKE